MGNPDPVARRATRNFRIFLADFRLKCPDFDPGPAPFGGRYPDFGTGLTAGFPYPDRLIQLQKSAYFSWKLSGMLGSGAEALLVVASDHSRPGMSLVALPGLRETGAYKERARQRFTQANWPPSKAVRLHSRVS